MAEITTNTTTKQIGVKRLNKKSTKVDLTPMVDLGFLLITFFVFTTTMAKPTVMNVVVPNDKDSTIHDDVCSSCALTVMLDKDNSIKYFEGSAENAIVKETNFSAEGIRKILVDKKQAVKQARGNANEMVLIIKPMLQSNFQNFVDITDEVAINGIKKYYIDDAEL
ncbi:MAG: biopolymer transporter ExbD [Chitinophagaceae bacterium]|nr:biopolymer transporter ExbD [Chitinophagaceae bacterium]